LKGEQVAISFPISLPARSPALRDEGREERQGGVGWGRNRIGSKIKSDVYTISLKIVLFSLSRQGGGELLIIFMVRECPWARDMMDLLTRDAVIMRAFLIS
jgi:hypothetical protein